MKKAIIFAVILLCVGGLVGLLSRVFGGRTEPQTSEIAEQSKPARFSSVVSSQSWSDHASSPSAGAGAGEKGSASVSGDRQVKIAAVIKSSGVEKRLLSINHMLEQQVELLISDEELSESERSAFLKSFNQNFNGESLLAAYREKMKESFSEAELDQLNAIYNDPQVLRFNQLNVDLMDPGSFHDYQEEFMEFVKNSEQNPLDPERQKLFVKLDEALNTSEQAASLTLDMFRLLDDGSEAEGDEKVIQEESFNAIKTAIKDQVQRGLMFALRDYQDSDMKELVQTMDNDLFKRASRLGLEVTREPFFKTMNELLKQLQAKEDAAKKPQS